MPAVIPYIPQQITVHLGAPGASAANVTVPFSDYVKNVASSEIYPTWEEAALRAYCFLRAEPGVYRILPQPGL